MTVFTADQLLRIDIATLDGEILDRQQALQWLIDHPYAGDPGDGDMLDDQIHALQAERDELVAQVQS